MLDLITRFLQIVVIDVLLSGDNAVVIALACRGLPPQHANRGLMLGALGAVVARVVLLFCASWLLLLPGVRIGGALLLLWIAIKLMLPQGEEEAEVKASTRLLGVMWVIMIADISMSTDNVVAVAAAAGGNSYLAAFGVLLSIPCIVWGSKILLGWIDRFPVIVTAGGCLLGWVAGGMLLDDPLVNMPDWHYAGSALGAALAFLTAKMTAWEISDEAMDVIEDSGDE